MIRSSVSILLLAVLGVLFFSCVPSTEKQEEKQSSVVSVSSIQKIKESGKLRISILFDTAKYVGVHAYPNNFQIDLLTFLAKELKVKPEFSIHLTSEYSYKILKNREVDLISDKIPVAEMKSLKFGLVFPFSSRRITQPLIYSLSDITDKLKAFDVFHYHDSLTAIHQEWVWAVNSESDDLELFVSEWVKKFMKSKDYRVLREKYVHHTASATHLKKYRKLRTVGKLTEFKDLIIKESSGSGIDWRLVASIIHQESKFNPYAVSPGGAMGLMQLVRATTKLYKVKNPFDPQENIRAGIQLLMQLDKQFADKIENLDERMWFVVASYNAGSGHIEDARQLARKYGKDPRIWLDNVECYLKMKANPEYYKDKVVRWGYCRGSHTADFTNEVMDRFFQYKATFPE
jgi:membrane-bound lytic murein transglycosylase MltF